MDFPQRDSPGLEVETADSLYYGSNRIFPPQRDSPGLEVETDSSPICIRFCNRDPQRDSPGLEVETPCSSKIMFPWLTHKGILQAWRLRPKLTVMELAHKVIPQRDSPGLEVETGL